jgi:CelD/BcsL family acetyltransferase involved in cellulose biosynthesis
MSVTLCAIDALSDSQTSRWNELLLTASPVRSAFLSHAFCKAVNDVRGGVNVLHIREQDGGEGFLPFQIRSGRSLLGHGEKPGAGMSDFFGVVGNLQKRYSANELLSAARLSALRFDHAVRALCPFSFDDAESSQGIRLHAESLAQFKDRLLGTNKDFVKSVLYRERRLAREMGVIEFSWKSTGPQALDRLIAAKRDQYRRTGVSDGLKAAWQRNLLHRLVEMLPAPSCEAVVSSLHAGGKWIASKFGLICADTLHSWFSVYDPEYRRYGPGHLVWFKVIEAGCAKGIRTFDFGEGESDYKSQYNGESYEVWKGAIRRQTLRGQSERVLQSLQWRYHKLTARRGPAQTLQ